MQKKIILGVDPGTQVTGYGVIAHATQKLIPIEYGNIYAKAKKLEASYLIIYERLEEIILRLQPNAIAVETQFVYKNIQSSIKLSMARAIVLLVAAKHGIEIFEYAPKKAKLAVTGNGSSSKHQVKKMITMLLNIKDHSLTEDAADALALAICHGHYQPRLANV